MRFSIPHRRRRVFSFFDFRSSFPGFPTSLKLRAEKKKSGANSKKLKKPRKGTKKAETQKAESVVFGDENPIVPFWFDGKMHLVAYSVTL